MKNPLLLFLLTACISASLPINKAFGDDTKCNLKLQQIRSSLEEKNIYIKSVKFRLATNPSSPYNNANQEVAFNLSGGRFEMQRTLDFMNSGKFKLDIASQVVEACDPVVRVVFALDHSDFINTYSYHKDIGVKKDKCREPQRGGQNDLNWGEEVCL
jgi:hypothetical protein